MEKKEKNKTLSIKSEVFLRGVDQIITKEELDKRLKSGKKLRIKFGSDITAMSLHIGHAVNLWKMRELQEYGHKVVFLIGDFTTQIGDPTGKTEARKKIPLENIEVWADNFITQVGKILLTSSDVFEVRKNSEWYGAMKTNEFLDILSLFTHAQLIERDMFQKRIREHKEILMHELMYPILQGYDSVMLKSDLTIIGSDQLFNENMGRVLQSKFGQEPQSLMTTTITPGIDGGEKMSKSLGNYIGLSDAPRDKFGKAMRILDSLIIPYLLVYTDVPQEEIIRIENKLKEGENPMEAKLFFAEALVYRYHGSSEARQEKEWFLKTFSEKAVDLETIPTKAIAEKKINIVDLVIEVGGATSKASARRLVEQGAVEVGGNTVKEVKDVEITKDMLVRVGKKIFVRII